MKINENAEMAKADTKKAMSDTGNEMAHAKADANADVEKIKADVENMRTHANADANADVEKIKADIDKKMADKQNG